MSNTATKQTHTLVHKLFSAVFSISSLFEFDPFCFGIASKPEVQPKRNDRPNSPSTCRRRFERSALSPPHPPSVIHDPIPVRLWLCCSPLPRSVPLSNQHSNARHAMSALAHMNRTRLALLKARRMPLAALCGAHQPAVDYSSKDSDSFYKVVKSKIRLDGNLKRASV